MGSVTAPRTLTTDLVSLQPPEEQDAALVAELMGVPEDAERPAEIVRGWREHWDEHGYGTWIATDGAGRRVGFVGLRAHDDFIRVTIRTLEGQGEEDLAGPAMRLVVAHALEWLPDLPLRLRVAPEDLATRFVAESAGMVHAPDLDHTVGEDDWQVLELPWVRVTDKIPARAREAMLRMWVEVNEAGERSVSCPAPTKGRSRRSSTGTPRGWSAGTPPSWRSTPRTGTCSASASSSAPRARPWRTPPTSSGS